MQEALELWSAFYDDPLPWRDLADRLGLSGQLGQRFGKLSGGQQQRLSIALALVGRPRVAILDELSTGLDPRARRDVWQLVREVRDTGVTVLLVTHAMEEAQALCDRIAIVDAGRIRALGTPEGLIRQATSATVVSLEPSAPTDLVALRELAGVGDVRRPGLHDEPLGDPAVPDQRGPRGRDHRARAGQRAAGAGPRRQGRAPGDGARPGARRRGAGGRRRLAREIHDTIAQSLAGVLAQLQAATEDTDPRAVRRRLDRAAALAREALAEARRSVMDLAPAPLSTGSLVEVVTALVEDWAAHQPAHRPMQAGVVVTGDARPLHPEVEATVLRITQEALANVAKRTTPPGGSA